MYLYVRHMCYALIIFSPYRRHIQPVSDIERVLEERIKSLLVIQTIRGSATQTLTTVPFVGSIRAVIVRVTDPVSGDAQVIVTGEGGGWAGRRWPRGAVLLVAAI